MGVSILLRTPKGKEIDVTPGWRSMMYGLLNERGLANCDLDETDIPALQEAANQQEKGRRDPPFDYASDIADSFQKIINAIREHGWVTIRCLF